MWSDRRGVVRQGGAREPPGADRALHLRRAMMSNVKRSRYSTARGVGPRAGLALALAASLLAGLFCPGGGGEGVGEGPGPGRRAGAAPPVPGQGGSAAASPTGPAAGASSAAAAPAGGGANATQSDGVDLRKLYEHFRRGVVVVERGGIPVAVGTVLGGDGRVLTALSALGGSDSVDIRYADGTSVHAKVGESDTGMDLALLVPKSKKWTDGLPASEADPTGTSLRALPPTASKGGVFGPAVAGVKGLAEAHSKDGQALLNLLDVDLKAPPVAGAPLLDADGGVVAVLVRACKGAVGGADPSASAASHPACTC